MADIAIVPQKELNYIETLYLYANLNDFINPVEFPEIDPYGAYVIMMKWLHDNLLCHAELISSTDIKTIYRFPNYRLLISDFDVAKRSNTFNVEIQYEQQHLFDVRNDINMLELPFNGTHDQYHIKRIDITKVAKHEEDYLSHKGFISSYRAFDMKGSSTKTETVYLGHRKNGNVLRMYNKTIELLTDTPKHPINYKKIALFSSYFGDIDNLYTYELELHRKVLKATLGMDKLSDIGKAQIIYNSIVGKVRIYENNEKNRKLIAQKKRERIEAYRITPYEPYDRDKVRKYRPSIEYLKRSVNKQIDNYMDSMEIEKTDKNKLKIYTYIMADHLEDNNYDMLVSERLEMSIPKVTKVIKGSAYCKDSDEIIEDGYSEMKEKHERLRDGNDKLQSESNEAFGKIKEADKQGLGEVFEAVPTPKQSIEEERVFNRNGNGFKESSLLDFIDGIKSEAKSR